MSCFRSGWLPYFVPFNCIHQRSKFLLQLGFQKYVLQGLCKLLNFVSKRVTTHNIIRHIILFWFGMVKLLL